MFTERWPGVSTRDETRLDRRRGGIVRESTRLYVHSRRRCERDSTVPVSASDGYLEVSSAQVSKPAPGNVQRTSDSQVLAGNGKHGDSAPSFRRRVPRKATH